jgi:phosphoribosylformylglycinamidine cyclo-ligase
MSNLYKQRGVSADKEDVHKAVKDLDKGLYPKAFCRIYPDYLAGDEAFCNIMHADGAGTKSVLAYLYWKETGDISVWRGIAQDALVMNLDDMLCVGSTGPYTYTSTIGRNASIIPGEVISEVINGTQEFIDEMAKHDIDIHFLGGETADVGDVVRTMIVDGTMMARMPKNEIIDSQKVVPGDVVVSIASFGKAVYEKEYNSGIGSNGLTSARHDLLKKKYATDFPEAVDPHLNKDVIFNGKYALTDKADTMENIGKLILSPTRTYAPLVKKVLKTLGQKINAIIHCSGGAQTKCLHYLPDNVRVVKNNLIAPPEIFTRIQEAVDTDWKEMYKVFNLGQRLEFYTDKGSAEEIIGLAKELGLEAQVSGYVESADKKSLLIESAYGAFEYV